MDVRVSTNQGIEDRSPDELAALLRGDTGLIWVDIPSCDDNDARTLLDVFGFHPLAVRDCVERNRVPKVHGYGDHVLVVLHAPERGQRGHVHYIELDQFIGTGWYITVHGPLNPKVAPEAARIETGAVTRRLLAGRFHPGTAHELSAAVVSALTARLRDYLTSLTEEVWMLERQVTSGHHGDAEEFLEELFQVRHGLLAVRTMAALSCEIYGRITTIAAAGNGAQALVTDVEDQFRHVLALA